MLLSLALSPLSLLIIATLLKVSTSHSFFPSKCPAFPPQQNFDWGKFAADTWYVTHKFDTSSSCLTYKFKQDNLGFKSIEQQRQLPLVGTVGLDHEYMRSCSILQRDRVEDPAITKSMKAFLDEELGEDASHDFDAIDQTGCADPDRETAINIDVDRLLGLKEQADAEYEDVYGDYEPDAELL